MREKMKEYTNNVRQKHLVYNDKEKAYLYNRGYIMGLSHAGAINNKDAFQLLDLNGLLRDKGVKKSEKE